MNKKAYIDHENSVLTIIGYHPEMAKEQTEKLGLRTWGWIDGDDRAIPDSWEEIELDLSSSTL